MSINSSMYIGASGLTAHGEAISVTGDNIANANTVGFKGSRASFEDIMGQSVMSSGRQSSPLGMGTRLGAVQLNFGQGSLQNTGLVTDLAIDGNGLFVFAGTQKGVAGNFYSRAGQLSVSNEGYLVNSSGLKLQGRSADTAGVIQSSVGDLRLGTTTLPPRATAGVTAYANLDARATTPAAFDPADPQTTSNFSTSIMVHDSLGTAHKVDVYYRNAGGGSWEWHALTDGANVTGGTAGTAFEGATGTLTFDTTGALTATTGTASSWNFVGATAAQAVTFDFGDDTASGGTGLAGSTQFSATSSVEALDQDGYAAGSLSAISISDDGTITGSYSNGERLAVGQVVLATFANDQGLERLGSSMFSQSPASGAPMIGTASESGRGRIVSGALEQSNVDLGKEFVDLIAFQRGFQANSKIITTADEMLQETMGLKR